mmetsp:Transcript_22502/g.67002  ORF Transcript_22502/g.67002 Transcript_22502/m.67002 type:complete len:105 (-) Transcript_22502:243-557(-)
MLTVPQSTESVLIGLRGSGALPALVSPGGADAWSRCMLMDRLVARWSCRAVAASLVSPAGWLAIMSASGGPEGVASSGTRVAEALCPAVSSMCDALVRALEGPA